jgi:GNAT superfamily N-acetyltransferase
VGAVQVTTWYLEMTSPEQQAPPPPAAPELVVRQAELPSPELSRALYTGVGSRWLWSDRHSWSWARWHDHLAREDVETWVAWVRGTPTGYAELERTADAVELVSFGLLPAFFGRGYGPRLLDVAVRRAWALGPRRVWVHTCTLDGPAALSTYRARGFEVYDERTGPQEVPDAPLEPWPGAGPQAP